ncbi:MAG: hypothetical protein H7235_07795 [Bdellovibrionaceae bacterium]|nr:hypothetical protein [Pseudobdellovibrionaceae bacterium]
MAFYVGNSAWAQEYENQTFKNWVKSKITFKDCENLFVDGTSINDFAIETFSSGLDKISKLNPNLVEDRLQSASKKDLLISCVKPEKLGTSGALFFKNNATFLNLIPLGTRYNIWIPKLPLHSQDPSVATMFFHEFLHFLEFDNLPRRLHNDGLYFLRPFVDQLRVRGKELDVVYACSSFAFPDTESESFSMDQFKETCQQARTKNSRVILQIGLINEFAFLSVSKLNSNLDVGCLLNRSLVPSKWTSESLQDCDQ